MTDKQIEELEKAIGAQPDIDKYIKMAYSGYQDEEIYDENDFNIATADWWVKACEHESARADKLQDKLDAAMVIVRTRGHNDAP